MLLRRILMAAAAGVVATGARAQLIVGSDCSPATIFHMGVNTSMATPLLAGGSAAVTWGMAYDHSTKTLYWNNGSTLYSSPISMSGLTPILLGTMTFQGSNVNFVGLGFRAGKLLGTRNIATEAVYEGNPVTLVATQLYAYPSAFDFGGIDVDASTGRLLGLNDATGGLGRGLYEIDTNAQTTALRAPYPAGESDIDGLAAHNGLAYYVTDQPGIFYIYDIASGTQVGTLPSPFTGSATFSAAGYIAPGPVSIEETSWGHIKNLYR